MNMKFIYRLPLLVTLALSGCGDGSSSGSDVLANGSSGSGTGGSLANMTILDGELHILSNNYIKSFSLESPLAPELIGSGWILDAETLFTYQNQYLFVGTSVGIEIFQPSETPNVEVSDYLQHISSFGHIRAYDPVIASNGSAYFTTRDGNDSGRSDVTDYVGLLDITDINNPNLIAEYNDLVEPVGLALRDNVLYICDRVQGLTLFTKERDLVTQNFNNLPYTLVPKFIDDFVACNDIIATDDQLIVTSAEGITQLRISNNQVTHLSVLRNQ